MGFTEISANTHSENIFQLLRYQNVQAGYGKCGIFSKQEQAVLKAVTSGMEVLGPKQELAVLVAATQNTRI